MTDHDLQLLLENSSFRDIDRQFARWLQRIANCPEPLLGLAAALVSCAVGRQHVCIDLRALAAQPWPGEDAGDGRTPDERVVLPELNAWISCLRAADAAVDSRGYRPLVLDAQDRLYLQRYWQYEQLLARTLREHAVPDPDFTAVAERFPACLDQILPRGQASGGPDWQRVAAFAAVRNRFLVLSGGPGTGKTYTVARILSLLLTLHRAAGRPPPRIMLAAPTGKAAGRLQEAIREAAPDDVEATTPMTAMTIHRMLGAMPGSSRCRYHRQRPLPADVVIVDEASMVALPLMAKVVDALPPKAKLILLGDMDQLASVEPGYVLGDICRAARMDDFSPAFVAEAQHCTGELLPSTAASPPPLADCAVRLVDSRRFPSGSPVAQLSTRVRQGTAQDARAAIDLLRTVSAIPESGLKWRPTPTTLISRDGVPVRALRELLIERYRGFLNADTPADALAALDRFRILAAIRQGPHGVETLNRLAEEILALQDVRARRRLAEQLEISPLNLQRPHYSHRPILISENAYDLGLFNGDIGVLMPADENRRNQRLRAWFRTASGDLREVSPDVLPRHETAFAMTVHKAQGSEFDDLLVMLPSVPSRVLSRELIYTAITRARQQLELWCPADVLAAAIVRETRRASGLRDALSAATCRPS